MLTRVSASQVKDYSLCPRKWFISHVLKEKGPERQSLKDGSALHEELEDYLVGGVILQRVKRKDLERDARFQEHVALAAPYLPAAPVPASVHIERWIELLTFKNGPMWVGKVDVIDASHEIIHILDHKSCGSFTHMLKQESLATDVQMGVYARYVLTNPTFSRKSRDEVKLTHTYIRLADKPAVKQVSAVAKKEQIAETWERSLGVVRDMIVTSELPSWEAVPPTVSACDAYGGCPYREKCGFVTKVDQITKGGKMSSKLLDRLKAENSGKPSQGIVPPDAPPRESTPEEIQEASEPKKGKKKEAEPVALVAETPIRSIVPNVKPAPYELYVDCLPIMGAGAVPIMFEEIMNEIANTVAEEAGVADVRFIKYEAKARLATHLRNYLDKLPKVIVVSSMHTHAETFLEVTIPHAKKYVRALRG